MGSISRSLLLQLQCLVASALPLVKGKLNSRTSNCDVGCIVITCVFSNVISASF